MAENAEPESRRKVNTASGMDFLDDTIALFAKTKKVIEPLLIIIRETDHGVIEFLAVKALVREEHKCHAIKPDARGHINQKEDTESRRYTLIAPVFSIEGGTILQQLEASLRKATRGTIKRVVRGMRGGSVSIDRSSGAEEDLRRIPMWYLVEMSNTEDLEAGPDHISVRWFSEETFKATHPSVFVYAAWTTLLQVFRSQKDMG